MTTRFQTQGPRVGYTPVERDRPFKQIVGLYNMWQSLAPETRDRIAGWFSRKRAAPVRGDTIPHSQEEADLMLQGLDTKNLSPMLAWELGSRPADAPDGVFYRDGALFVGPTDADTEVCEAPSMFDTVTEWTDAQQAAFDEILARVKGGDYGD